MSDHAIFQTQDDKAQNLWIENPWLFEYQQTLFRGIWGKKSWHNVICLLIWTSIGTSWVQRYLHYTQHACPYVSVCVYLCVSLCLCSARCTHPPHSYEELVKIFEGWVVVCVKILSGEYGISEGVVLPRFFHKLSTSKNSIFQPLTFFCNMLVKSHVYTQNF